MYELPAYDDLPLADSGGRSGWGLFGATDSAGLMNLMTPETVKNSARLVRSGSVFPLDAPLNMYDPPLFGRSALTVDVTLTPSRRGLDEVYHGFNPQASSQWDALAHAAYRPDRFYNDARLREVREDGRNGIHHWAKRGIVGRGVLLDLARTAELAGRPYSPGTNHAFSVADLEAARKAAGVEYAAGDVVILRTGFPAWYLGIPVKERAHIAKTENFRACGVEHTEAMARYLWNSHASAVAADCPALEVWPMDFSDEAAPFGSLHQTLIGLFGMGVGELWWLEDLADDCAKDGRHEFFFASAPLNNPGGVGSPANALAIK